MSNENDAITNEQDALETAETSAEATAMSNEVQDIIGEMTSISMGSGTSALSALIGQDIDLANPDVTLCANHADLAEPFAGEEKVLVFLNYTEGFSASTCFSIKTTDAKQISNMMLGNADQAIEAGYLDELQQNALLEAMTQVMTAGATSLAGVMGRAVDIDSPQVFEYSADKLVEVMPALASEAFTAIRFTMAIADGKTIEMEQYITNKAAEEQLVSLLADDTSQKTAALQEQQKELVGAGVGAQSKEVNTMSNTGTESGNPTASDVHVDPVTVSPVAFSSFDDQQQIYGEENKNLELVMDVSLSLAVELGKTNLSIKEVLELTRGSVVELDRVAGEPVDLLANGKLIAKGEVVVIEDNFGLRITSIVSPADRIRGI